MTVPALCGVLQTGPESTHVQTFRSCFDRLQEGSIVKNHKHLEIEKQILCTDSTPIIRYATASNLAPTFMTPVKLLSKIGTQRTARQFESRLDGREGKDQASMVGKQATYSITVQ